MNGVNSLKCGIFIRHLKYPNNQPEDEKREHRHIQLIEDEDMESYEGKPALLALGMPGWWVMSNSCWTDKYRRFLNSRR